MNSKEMSNWLQEYRTQLAKLTPGELAERLSQRDGGIVSAMEEAYPKASRPPFRSLFGLSKSAGYRKQEDALIQSVPDSNDMYVNEFGGLASTSSTNTAIVSLPQKEARGTEDNDLVYYSAV